MSVPLLATKLHVPPPRPDAVPRPRLVARLDAALAHGLVVVSAAAGYGKTALVSTWAAHRDRPVAWVTLEPGDSDPARFWAYVAAALGALPGFGGQPGMGAIERPAPAGANGTPRPAAATLDGDALDITRAALLNAAATLSDQDVLILDDFHLVDSPDVHTGLSAFVERLPPALGIVLLSRGDPPLPLGRFRLRGRLAELRAEDLRFTPDEARELLRRNGGADLAADDEAALVARAEGWPAGLMAAALALRGRSASGAADIVAAFTGSHRYLLDYLDEEVLDRLPRDERAFLLATAVLERLTGSLCDAVTGDPRGRGAAMLERLDRANLFISPVDDARRWYRYHSLFAERLRHRLLRERPGDFEALHRRAGAWFAQAGLVGDAIRHALAGGADGDAAALIESVAGDELARGAYVTVEGWIRKLPEAMARARPRLAIALAQAMVHTVSLEAAEGWLDAAETALGAVGESDVAENGLDTAVELGAAPRGEARASRGLIAATRARIAAWRRDAAGAITHGRAALADLPPDSPLRADVALSLGTAHHLAGAPRDAAEAFAQAVGLSRAAGHRSREIVALCMSAEARKAEGRLRDAATLAARSLELARARGGEPDPVIGRAAIVMGNIHVEHHSLDAARACAETALACAGAGGSRVTLVAGQILLANVGAAAGDFAAARRAAEAAEAASRSRHAEHLAAGLRVFQAQLAWHAGDVAAAARWADVYEHDSTLRAPATPFEHDSADGLLARVRLAQGRFDDAAALVERLVPDCQRAGRGEALLSHRILSALIHQARGDTRRAIDDLAIALAAGGPEGYTRLFVREGRTMAELLRMCAARGVAPEDAARLLAQMRPALTGGRPRESTPGALVEPLTEREAEVLRLVAAGLSNREIAESLVITIGTVKRHITNLHGKLGVESRTRAIARARELGLVR